MDIVTVEYLLNKPIKYRRVKAITPRGKLVDGVIYKRGYVFVKRNDGLRDFKLTDDELSKRLFLA